MISLFFKLVAVHFVGDYLLQTDKMVKYKAVRNAKPDWYWWLTAHGFIHGLMVYLITGNEYFGIFATVTHVGIDYGKCLGKYGMNIDQILHVLSAAVIVSLSIL